MAEVDLLLVGGTVVTPLGQRRAHVAVGAGHILSVGLDRPTATEVVDVSGLLILPGAVDTHVHLMDPGSTEREDFPTGTAAAAASGVTTIVEHSHGQPIRSAEDLVAKRAYLRDRSNVDYGLAAHAWPGEAGQVAALWGAGATFFKVFTCTTHGVPGHNIAALKEHLDASAQSGAVSLLHCEDESLTGAAEAFLRAQGRDDPGLLPDWRSREAELVAAVVASLLVRITGARASIAHVSNPDVASYIAAERARGASMGAEACPQYFLLRENEVLDQGALRKFTPPARARTQGDEDEMWRLLRAGTLTHMSTDHAPSTLAQKQTGDMWNVHFGLPGLDTTMAVLLDAAARERLSYEDVTRVYSQVPAKLYGLWPQKGHLGAGSDADLIVVDPTVRRTLRNEDVLSKAGWTPFHGRPVVGQVVRTYLRGRLIAEEGRPLNERTGQFLPGAGATS